MLQGMHSVLQSQANMATSDPGINVYINNQQQQFMDTVFYTMSQVLFSFGEVASLLIILANH